VAKVTQNNTKCNVFEPTPEMKGFIEAYINAPLNEKKSKICENLGVARSTVWRWEKNPQYIKWRDKILEENFASMLTETHRTVLNKCLRGDMVACKMYWQRFDPNFLERKEQNLRFFDEEMSELAKKKARERLTKGESNGQE